MIHDLVEWMDDHFGHDLTNIVINVTVIGRGVELAFSSPRFKAYSSLKGPLKLLLQTGFARECRHATWSDIVANRAYSHVVGQFVPFSTSHLPEAKAAILAALSHIGDGEE